MSEQERILNAYRTRQIREKGKFFTYESLAHVYRINERHYKTLNLLAAKGLASLSTQHILDVGCGDGDLLRQFLQWGAVPENLAGIELRAESVDYARRLTPDLDIRCGSATSLPWPAMSFDLVCLHTVFTSIFDSTMKHEIAAEMNRVLRPGGLILWYDFMYNNPRNPDVRGIKPDEMRTYFPGFDFHLQRITLAPPIARRLPMYILPVLYPLLSAIPLLRTHYLGLFTKPL